MSQSRDLSTHHLHLLGLALDEARKCEPTPTAFCVGCILTVASSTEPNKPIILARGYSRELPGNTHAEANALAKAHQLSQTELSHIVPFTSTYTIGDLLTCADIYTTMEPCSIRTSGLAPCADAIIAARIRRCFIGVGEPDDFVKCEGARKLADAGVEVIWLKGFEDECLEVARRGQERL
ncbi:cytidine deaminase-like protein [Sparassis latifolia]